MLPLLPAKQRQLPDSDWLEQDSLVACPDPDERVIMRIERIGEPDAPDRRPHVSPRAELGLALQTDKPVGEYAALARLAEDAGFDVVTTFNDLWFQPALPALLEIAAATKRVRVGPSCLNPFTLHPVELAGQVAALDRASGGRAFLGLAAGAWLEPLGIDASQPLTAVREAWEIVRRLLAGDDAGFTGKRFSLAAGERLRYPVVRPAVPLLVGTWAPRLAAFAGEARRRAQGRRQREPRRSSRTMRERAGSERRRHRARRRDRRRRGRPRARALARREVAMYVDVVGALDPTTPLEPELLRASARSLQRGTMPPRARSSPTTCSTASRSPARLPTSRLRRRPSSTQARCASTSGRRTGSTSGTASSSSAAEVLPRLRVA